MERKDGLYSPDGSFRSTEKIKRDLALRGELPQIIHHTPVKLPRDATDYLTSVSERAKIKREVAPQSENFLEVTIPPDSIVNLWGDLHLHNENTDHDRVLQELEVMRNTGHSFVVMGADLVDGIHWGGEGGGEQVGSLTEQAQTMRSIFRALKGRVIVGVSGEHDSKWAMRTGGDPYAEFSEGTEAPYVKGTGEILIHCGEQDYRMVVQHRARGYSMYNKNHPTYRQARFDLQGADIYVNFHTHNKQISQETLRQFGEARVVTHISGGAYKPTDGYGARSGFAEMKPEQMYGASIRLRGDRKKVDVEYDILEAHRRWAE